MFNKVIIAGRLGRDPELRSTNNGKSVCQFSVATTNGFGDNKKTEWFNVTTWEKTAENCSKYLGKGSLVLVVGRLETNKFTDKNGTERESKDLIAQEVTFLDSRQEGGQQHPAAARPASSNDRDF